MSTHLKIQTYSAAGMERVITPKHCTNMLDECALCAVGSSVAFTRGPVLDSMRLSDIFQSSGNCTNRIIEKISI